MATIYRTPLGNISVVGRIGGEPMLNYSMNNNPICNFSLAVEEGYDDAETGEFGVRTTWYRVVVLDAARAEQIHQRIQTGMTIAVAGRHVMTDSIRESDGMEFKDQHEIIATRFNLKGLPIELTDAEKAVQPARMSSAMDEANEPDESRLTVKA